MSRALVLGGGGPVGVGWEAGLVMGLADEGVALRDADMVLGTSAGSAVGAQLTSGQPLTDMVEPISHPPPWLQGQAASGDLMQLLEGRGADVEVPEDAFVARFGFLRGVPWPAAFRCTSFGIDSGQPVVWDRAAGVDVDRAVASSCSIPGVSPAITLNGERYIDGGVRDQLNADLAIGYATVVAVCTLPLDPPDGLVLDLLAGLLPATRARIEDLRASGSAVAVVEPSDEVGELFGWGRHLLDFRRTQAAYDAGVRQGKAEAGRIGALWSS